MKTMRRYARRLFGVAFAGVAIGAAAEPSQAGANPFRPAAVPLVNVEPHFSLWSAADRLYEADTTFWAGQRQALSVLLTADGVQYRLCGRSNGRDLPVLPQVGVTVGATETRCRFADRNGLSAELDFLTPRLTDDLDVFSRPVTYLSLRVSGAKEWSARVEIADAFATNDDKAKMTRAELQVGGLRAVRVGRSEQVPFSSRGDRRRPDWGYAWLVGPARSGDVARYLLAYDNLESVRFFGKPCADWWRRDGKLFDAMLGEAMRDCPALETKCRAFDAQLAADLTRIGGRDYAEIAALAWRQSFGACKFVAGPGGEPMLFSNECGSGGMIGTTDVFYPQLPHLLMTSLTLAKASLAPTCIYAASTNWPYAYAPHDLGLFPVAEGQYYGMKKGQSVGGGTDDTYRMPVEECGNMLLSLAAVAKAEGNADFAGRWWGEVSKWAAYLERFGYDPGNQLCTDDFAGHLAHNANLSVKSILALAAYALMADLRGEAATAVRYRALAAGLVPKWLEAAKGGAHGGFRIAFDRPDSWSLKYNLVWDRLLDFNLFPPEVAERELQVYRAVACDYGVPLDCRKTYTKADWLVWCGALTGRREDLAFMVRGIRRFLHETPDRIPFSDWYFADSGLQRGFVARSVVGGVFLPVLQHPDLVKAYRRELQNTVPGENQIRNRGLVRFEGNGTVGGLLCVGSSYAWHGPNEAELGWSGDWGMAASAREKDVVHLLWKELRKTKPDAPLCIVQCAGWERNYTGDVEYLERNYAAVKNFRPDWICFITTVGNAQKDFARQHPLGAHFDVMADWFRQTNPSARVVLSSTGRIADHRAAIRDYGRRTGIPVVDHDFLDEEGSGYRALGRFRHPGVAWHPSDRGFAEMARRYLSVLNPER